MVAATKFNSSYTSSGSSNESSDGFYACTPFSEAAIENLIIDGLPGGETILLGPIEQDDEDFDVFDISYTSSLSFGDHYRINFDDQVIEAGNMYNYGTCRGVGRRMFTNRVLLGLVHQFTQMNIEAGDMMGGRAWAACKMIVAESNIGFLRKDLKTRLGILQPYLDEEQHETLALRCDLRHPDDLFMITKLNDVVAVVPSDFDTALELTAVPSKTPYTHAAYVSAGFIGEKEMTIDQFMLCGLRYDGHVSLQDPESLKILEKFTDRPLRGLARTFVNWNASTQPMQSAGHLSNRVCRTALRR